jgi:DNA-binding CsgD family transcriptional regulator/sugar-specific transcriptional regulator TrmB
LLHVLGLDETCTTVYRAVLAHPEADLSDLRAMLELTDAQLRAALDRLSELALVRAPFDSPHAFRAVNPEMAIQALLAREEERVAAEQHRIEQIRLAAAQLAADFTTARAHQNIDGIEILDGIDEIRDRIRLLVRDVRDEVLALTPGGAQSEASMEAARPQDQALLERGVRMRTLYLDSVRNSPPTVAYAKWLTEHGGEVRTAPSLPVRLTILDRKIAIVPVDDEDTAAGALVLTGTGTLTALSALFDTIWTHATPLGAPTRERDEHGLNSQEQAVLRLLGQGLTDEAVAKRLGVSPRTARRIAADLMELLGARSRFQAGCRAVAKGWLSGDLC